MSTTANRSTPSLSTSAALLLGTLAVGTLDLLDAVVFFGTRGVTVMQVLQSIASGLLGRPAFTGGARTAALGLVLHYFIAFGIVATYLAASRSLTLLARQPWVCGPLYGLAVYTVMNYVVLPLSAAVTGHRPLAVVVNGLIIHALGVGLPSALAARAAGPSASPPAVETVVA
jgi:hypothetical protein